MSAPAPAPAPAGSLTIIDLTEGMDDLDVESQSGAEDFGGEGELKPVCVGAAAKKKARKSRRGGKSKKVKAMEKAIKLSKSQDDKSEDEDIDIASQASSRTISEAGTQSTVLLAEPYQPPKEPDPYADATIPDIHVPVLSHYDIRELPGSGEVDTDKIIVKVGVFATQPIPIGTRIIHESPMITLPHPGDQVLELMDAFDALTPDQQAQIWSLNPCDSSISPLLSYMGAQVADKIRTLTTILGKSEITRTHEDLVFLNDLPKLSKAAEMCRIAARWHASRHSLIDLPESERSDLPPDTPITGLFVETARLRHSCVPNCYAHFSPATNRMTVHAIHDISPGEELTLSTIAAVYYTTLLERRAELNAKYGLTCTCPACTPTSPSFAAHESSRFLAHARAVQLNHFLTHVSLLSDKSVARDLCLRESSITELHVPELQDLRDAADTIGEVVGNLRDVGCGASPEVVRWYGALVDRVAPRLADALDDEAVRLKCWRGILGKAGECVEISKMAFGADSVEVAQTRMREVKIRKLVENAEERLKAVEESKKKLGAGQKKAVGKEKKKIMLEKVARMLEEAKEKELISNENNKREILGKMGRHDVVRE